MRNVILQGNSLDVLKKLPDDYYDCACTSPPYWGLRNYENVEGQIGLEKTPELYVEHLADVFREMRRVLKPQGTFWLNIGDCYAGGNFRYGNSDTLGYKQASNQGSRICGAENHKAPPIPTGFKPKDRIGIPHRVVFALQADGWYWRDEIIWHKPNPMPESVTDRTTKAHEFIFLLTKSPKYYYDHKAIREEAETKPHARGEITSDDGTGMCASQNVSDPYRVFSPDGKRNKRSVWPINVRTNKGLGHYAAYPEELIKPCILAGCPEGGIVLDPFCGTGTTCKLAIKLKRDYLGIDINPRYVKEIAELHIQEVETGIPVAEQRNGQKGLFDG